MKQLEVLNLSFQYIREIPDDITLLENIRILRCCENKYILICLVICRIDTISAKIMDLNHLEELDLRNNKLSYINMIYVIYSVLPKEIGRLPCLTKLDISGNSICFIPIVFMRLTSLEYFNFSDNKIELFPYFLGYLPSLRVLYYKNNPFQNIDPSIVSNSSSLINALHQYLIEHPDEYSLEEELFEQEKYIFCID